MANMLLTIQHNEQVFSPPVENGIKLEWERTGAPGKLTFTTIQPSSGSMEFTEGDPVCFYYADKPIFMGYVFTKKHDKERKIQVTCYDQIRYLKNKFTYVFENKTATQIVTALCEDFDLYTGEMDNTNYVIPAIAEENKAALDIVLDVLEETLTNTGDMFVLYDDFGKLKVKNVANMISRTLLYEDTAENFDYSSSIDEETYNQVVLYYKKDDEIVQLYTAQSPSSMKQWGTLRYFEEVKSPTIGQNKANSLLQLYNRRTRELKVTGAFGDITVRGGTLIPVKLNLGDVSTENYMLVDKVTHNFDDDLHTMDLTLQGSWGDKTTDMVSNTIGNIPSTSTGKPSDKKPTDVTTDVTTGKYDHIKLNVSNYSAGKGSITLTYYKDGMPYGETVTSNFEGDCDKDSTVNILIRSGTEIFTVGEGGTDWYSRENQKYLSKLPSSQKYSGSNYFTSKSGSNRIFYINYYAPTTYNKYKFALNVRAFVGEVSISYYSYGIKQTINKKYTDTTYANQSHQQINCRVDENSEITVKITRDLVNTYSTIGTSDWAVKRNGNKITTYSNRIKKDTIIYVNGER
jgi:hypothetical protein